MVPDRLWYRTDCVVRGCLSSCVPARPAARQSFSYTVSGVLLAGGEEYIFMVDWSALITPPEGHPGQHAYTFVIHIPYQRLLPSE
jgi:hypothetical protein